MKDEGKEMGEEEEGKVKEGRGGGGGGIWPTQKFWRGAPYALLVQHPWLYLLY